MAARTDSVDPRAERVRARLRDAAFALAHERPVDQLTVGDIVPSAVTPRVVAAFRAELAPACEQIAAEGMRVVTTVASLTPESVSRFLIGGFMEVLRSWMEDPDATDLRGRVTMKDDSVNLG